MADETVLETSPEQKKKPLLLMLIGGFFLLYLLNCTAIYFLLKPKYDARLAELKVVADSIRQSRPDTLQIAAPQDSLLPAAPGDSLLLTAQKDSLPADSLQQLAALDTAALTAPDTSRFDTVLYVETTTPPKEVVIDTLMKEDYAARMKKLVNIVDKMKPQETATVMARLEDEFVVQVLLRMRERTAAKVLSEMPPARAARLSKLMTGKIDS